MIENGIYGKGLFDWHGFSACGPCFIRSRAAGGRPRDVAVDTRTAFGKPPRSLHLEPVESLSVPKNPDIPYGMISRVHLYADRSHGSGEDSIYLVAEMNFCGEDGDQPHIVGIFAGSPAGEPCMRLADLDRDGIPELVLVHEAGAGASYMRIFRISQEPNVYDDKSCISASAMLKQVGCCRTGMGTVRLEDDGTVVVKTYPEGGKIPASVKKYRLEQGADGMKEVE